jgi:hypothetical protein
MSGYDSRANPSLVISVLRIVVIHLVLIVHLDTAVLICQMNEL